MLDIGLSLDSRCSPNIPVDEARDIGVKLIWLLLDKLYYHIFY